MHRKKVIVTGGSGYVGGEVIRRLLQKEYTVVNIDKNAPRYNETKVRFIQHNLLRSRGLSKYFNEVDYCIHLAAEVGGVAFANKFPAQILERNATIDLNVLNAAVKGNVEKIVYISSSLVYEQGKKFPLKEEYSQILPPAVLSYGLEKLFGESLCEAYSQQYGLTYSICRLFNVYGNNAYGYSDPNGHVIPDLIEKVKKAENVVELWGDKGTARNFTHVRDIASGIVKVLETNASNSEIFNIASRDEYTLEKIVEILWKILEKSQELKFVYKQTNFKDVKRNLASIEKAENILHWKTKIELARSLKQMV